MTLPRDGDFELITLRTGKRAVRHLGHGEVMHPSVGPWEEANRLYVDQVELERRLGEHHSGPLRILDVGLGAATNAVAVLTRARSVSPRRQIELTSLEVDLAPLRLAHADPEGFPFLAPFTDAVEALSAHGQWEEEGIRWRLLLGDAEECLSEVAPDQELVLFDPFSPKSNPALWTPTFLARVRERCRADGEGAVLATYSAATPTRVSLLMAGFFVGAGLSTGQKGETTIAATRLEALQAPLEQRWLARWERSTARAPHGAEWSEEVEAQVRAHPQFGGLTR